MKNFSWILALTLGCSAFAQDSHVMSSEDRFDAIRDSLQRIEDRIQTRSVRIKTKDWNWDELDQFQSLLWKAMALDPAAVPATEIPMHLDPVNLTRELKKGLARLVRARHVAEKYHAEDHFDEYVTLAQELIEMREKDLYRKARVIVKRGALEEKYTNLTSALAAYAQSQLELTVNWDKSDREEIREGLARVSAEFREVRDQGVRTPASFEADKHEKGGSVKTLMWVLMPLFFLTGLVGGLSWNDDKGGRKRRIDAAEPKP